MAGRRDDVIELQGDRVILRGFRPDEIDLAMGRMAGGSSMVAVGDPTDRERKRRDRLERSGSRNDWEILFAIEAGGRLVGDAQGRCSETAMPPGVWEIGLEVWDVADRGRGLGRRGARDPGAGDDRRGQRGDALRPGAARLRLRGRAPRVHADREPRFS
jgi:hypothetical protein